MSLSKRKCWYSSNFFTFLKRADPFALRLVHTLHQFRIRLVHSYKKKNNIYKTQYLNSKSSSQTRRVNEPLTTARILVRKLAQLVEQSIDNTKIQGLKSSRYCHRMKDAKRKNCNNTNKIIILVLFIVEVFRDWGGFVEHLSATLVAQQSVNNIISLAILNLVTPKVGARHELLFNKPASEFLIR